MRKLSLIVAALSALASIAAAPAAGGELCYDLDVNVNGEQIADESGCEELPALEAPARAASQPGELCYDVAITDVVAEADCVELP